MHVISVLEKIQGRLEYAYVRLALFPTNAISSVVIRPEGVHELETNLDAHEDERLETLAIEQGEELGCGHREERLSNGGEVQRAERRKVEAVISFPEAYSISWRRRLSCDPLSERFAGTNLSDSVR
jgi:hypothetical protein